MEIYFIMGNMYYPMEWIMTKMDTELGFLGRKGIIKWIQIINTLKLFFTISPFDIAINLKRVISTAN